MDWSSKKGGSGGSRGRVGRRSAAGDLRVGSHSVTGEEAKRVGQGGGWATLLLSCLPLGLETCYISNDPPTIHRVSKHKTELATLGLNLVTLVQ